MHVTSCEWARSACPFVTGVFSRFCRVCWNVLSKARQHFTVRALPSFIRTPVTDVRTAPPANAAYECPLSCLHFLRVRAQKRDCWVTAVLP